MRRLMTHLAQFSSLSTQGELLCTQGLEYLLENSEARSAFATYIPNPRTGDAPLTWRAEVVQKDGNKPDLEACTADGKPVVKIEAKLGAAFSQGQLNSYVDDLEKRSGGGLLLVLVPQHRSDEAKAWASSAFALPNPSEQGPWQLNYQNSTVALISWEGVLETFKGVRCEAFRGDLDQFSAMYKVLQGLDIEPLTSDEEVLRWWERAGVFVSLVDRVTRKLTTQLPIMPMGKDPEPAPHGYQRRYVCVSSDTQAAVLSVGVRDPFSGALTPVWLRFRSSTPALESVRARINASALAQGRVESGGHIWIPLHVPLGVDGEGIVASLVGQAKDVLGVAYPSAV